MSTHTPGPWMVHPYRDVKMGPHNFGIDVGPPGRMVAQVCGEFEKPQPGLEAEGNALLIAAAPAMRELLLWIEREGGVTASVRDRVRAVLDQADGREEPPPLPTDRRNADRIDGYDRDDLGESPDF